MTTPRLVCALTFLIALSAGIVGLILGLMAIRASRQKGRHKMAITGTIAPITSRQLPTWASFSTAITIISAGDTAGA